MWQLPRIYSRLSSLILLALAVCNGCSSSQQKAESPPPGVTVTTVLQKDVPVYQEWVGTMAGNVDADIRPKVEGFLLKQLYTEGAFLKQGQPMFQLDQRQSEAAVQQAQGQLEQARAAQSQADIDVNRYTPLVQQKAVSQAELDKATSMQRAATAQVEAAQAVLDNARLNLNWATVVSPISGIAGVAKVGVGDLMTPNTVMTTVSAVNPVYVDFSIAEQDYLRFSRDKTGRGEDLELILGDGTAYPQRGHSLLINREVDSRTGTIQVRAEFPNPTNILRPGQYARIRSKTEVRKNALLIPQRAIAELQGIYQVAVVDSENKVTIRAVKTGPQFGDMWVIESGLQPQEKVVVDGLQRLRDGMTVSPSDFKDTQANAVHGGE